MFLLEVQTFQGTVIFLRNTGSRKDVIEQLLPFVSDILHQHRHKKHALIPALQIL